MRRGFKSTTVDDIAALSGISKKTLYEKFENKEQLVEYVVRQFISHINTSSQDFSIGSADAIEELIDIHSFTQQHIKKMSPNAFIELKKYYPEAFEIFKDFKNLRLYEHTQNNIARGQKEGLYRKEINPELISRYRVETIMMIFQERHEAFENFSFSQLNREILLHFVYGLVTIKGNNLLQKYLEKII